MLNGGQVPRPRQMLFFGYKFMPNSSRMDNGGTEHSGCPLRKGELGSTVNLSSAILGASYEVNTILGGSA